MKVLLKGGSGLLIRNIFSEPVDGALIDTFTSLLDIKYQQIYETVSRKSTVPVEERYENLGFEVTKENYLVLQLLEMIKIVSDYMDGSYEEAGEKIRDYIVDNDISKSDIDEYIGLFPLVVYKNYYEMRIENVFA